MDKDVKAAVDALAKELAQNEKALAKIPAAPAMDRPELVPDNAHKAISATKAQAEKASKVYSVMESEADKLHRELEAAMKAALAQCKAGADKATKAYMDAVKNTDGLTSAKPSIVKVLQATGKSPDPAAIQSAIVEMTKHRSEMSKTYGKDKDKAKLLAAFNKNLDAAAKALGGLV